MAGVFSPGMPPGLEYEHAHEQGSPDLRLPDDTQQFSLATPESNANSPPDGRVATGAPVTAETPLANQRSSSPENDMSYESRVSETPITREVVHFFKMFNEF